MRESSLWTEHPVPAETPVVWRFGPLQVWCKSQNDELWLAHHYTETEEATATPTEAEPPEDLAWTRWVLKQAHCKIRFTPRFPDRPLVVKPDLSFLLTRRAKARVYVGCPLWVHIELREPCELCIEEIPTVVLSSTWFGAFTEGDLCYWTSSRARRRAEPDPAQPHLALCPIQIVNESEEELKVENICFRVAGLSLFLKDGQLWANESTLAFSGKEGGSEIEVAGTPPAEAKGAQLISPPREPARQGIAARTFASLRDLPGLGLR